MDDNEKIQWHAAFREALKIEFEEYLDVLQFVEEHPLTTEPLRIDVVIIKKLTEVHIKKNIGQIFKGHNIIEYKSPEESLTLNGYYKTFAYAYLYASLNGLDIDDMTITYVTSKHPRDLLKYINNNSRTQSKTIANGIHIILGENPTVQIVEQSLLSPEENMFLYSLMKNLNRETFDNILYRNTKHIYRYTAYLHALMNINRKISIGDDTMERTIADLLLNNDASTQQVLEILLEKDAVRQQMLEALLQDENMKRQMSEILLKDMIKKEFPEIA